MHWINATVERKVVWAPGLFTLSISASSVAPFEAGQFLQLGITLDGKRVNRPYSVASPFGSTLEFFIVLVEDGHLTPHLWKLNPGDSVEVSEKAAGSFTLSHSPDAKSLWLLATGTGIAPYIAMLRTAEPWQRYERIIFVHGVRHKNDLAYQSELASYRAKYGGRFTSISVVSREDVPGSLSGRITTCIANGSLENLADQALTTQSCVMMCGNPDMLSETEKMLEERGLKRHRAKSPGQIVVERYW
ncbi:MAG: ferredoxin--NADP reductase [Pirellulaceae bacterium]|nr:ferredoxin--NADP reductase [Pirellulaceae bacterium]